MIKKIGLFLLLLFSISIKAQLSVGEWRLFSAFTTPSKVVETPKKIYYLSNGFLYSYGKDDKSNETVTRKNGLSDFDISDIEYNPAKNILVIIYSNSNVDIMEGNKIYNIGDIKNKAMSSSKNINSVYFHGDNIYLSTDFGIVSINSKKKEISETYSLGKAVYNTAILDEYIYASTKTTGLYRANLKDNLLDPINWKYFYNGNYIKTLQIDDFIMFVDNNNKVYKMGTDCIIRNFLLTLPINGIKETSTGALLKTNTHVYIYDKTMNLLNTIDLSAINLSAIDISSYNNQSIYWILNEKGITALQSKTDNVIVDGPISPNTQIVNIPYNLTFANNNLYVTNEGNGIYMETQGLPAYISILNIDNNKWTNLSGADDIPRPMHPGVKFANLYGITVDPVDPNTFYTGSFLEGLYVFKNNKYDSNYNPTNSPIDGIGDEWAFKISGTTFDKNNNLWMLNYSNKSGVKVLRRENGKLTKWSSLNYSDLLDLKFLEQLLISKNSNSNVKWVIQCATNVGFVFAFDDKGTLDNMNDDQFMKFNTFIDQDDKVIDATKYYCMAEDRKGTIWIGTNRGPILINNPSKAFNADFKCTRVKIPRNDGTNLADLLLSDETITSILIDGGNRKWLGTANSGIYLISEDGTETIYHFDTNNSILPSNKILSLAMNPSSGELFIGTEKGLVSYRTETSEPKEDFSSVYAFPNPVRPDFTGWITITGLQDKSLVKITDSTGNLIHQAISEGGQIVWDGRNNNTGKRVKTGVYLVFASNAEGKSGVVTKILVVN